MISTEKDSITGVQCTCTCLLILNYSGNSFIIISRGRSRKFRKGWLEHLPTWQLYRYLLFFWEFYNNTSNTKFQRKRGGHNPRGPPLNPPLISFIYTTLSSSIYSVHGMALLHVMCLQKPYNVSCLMKIKPRTYCLVSDLYTTQLVWRTSGKYFPCYKVITWN